MFFAQVRQSFPCESQIRPSYKKVPAFRCWIQEQDNPKHNFCMFSAHVVSAPMCCHLVDGILGVGALGDSDDATQPNLIELLKKLLLR